MARVNTDNNIRNMTDTMQNLLVEQRRTNELLEQLVIAARESAPSAPSSSSTP